MSIKKITESRKQHFLDHVFKCVADGLTHIDAICDYCEKNNIDTSTVASLIPKPMKEKMFVEATELNFIRGEKSPPKLFE